MKFYLFIFILLTLFVKTSFSQRNLTVTIEKRQQWYYLIFSKESTNSSDSIWLLNSNYKEIKKDRPVSKFKVINTNQVDISKSIKLISYTTIKKYKIFMFYYPGFKESNLDFNGNGNKKTLIELRGMHELDKIIKRIP